MISHPAMRFLRMFLPACAGIALLASTLAAEAPVAGASGSPSESVGEEDIRQVMETVRSAEALSEANRTRATDLLQEALVLVGEATRRRQADAEIPARLRTAADRVREAHDLVAMPMPEPPKAAELGKDMVRSEVEAAERKARDDLRSAGDRLLALEEDLARRARRPDDIRKRIPAARDALEAARGALRQSPPAGEAEAVSEARRIRSRARILALQAEIDSLRDELSRHDIELSLAAAERDVALREVRQAEQAADAWQDYLASLRERSSRLRTVATAKALADADRARLPDAVRAIAEKNVALAEQAEESTSREADLVQKSEDTAERLRTLEVNGIRLDERLDVSRGSRANGVLLREILEGLPSPRILRGDSEHRLREMARLKTERLELDVRRRALSRLDEEVQTIIAGITPAPRGETRREMEETVRRLLTEQLAITAALYESYGREFESLGNIEETSSQLLREAEELHGLIAENLLWARSIDPLGPADALHAAGVLRELLSHETWRTFLGDVFSSLREKALYWFLGILLITAAFVFRHRLSAPSAAAGFGAGVYGVLSPVAALKALGRQGLAAACWPIALAVTGLLLRIKIDASNFTHGLAGGLSGAGLALFALALLREICRDGGACDVHFHWTEGVRTSFRQVARLGIVYALPCRFLYAMASSRHTPGYEMGLGRPAFIAAMLVVILAFHRLLAPHGAVYESMRQRFPRRITPIPWRVIRCLPAVVFLLLVWLAAKGYFFAALLIQRRLLLTLWLALGLSLWYSLMLCWWVGQKARLTASAARERNREAERMGGDAHSGEPSGEVAIKEAPRVQLEVLGEQSRRILNALTVALGAVGLYATWANVFPALGHIGNRELWSYAARHAEGGDVVVSVTVGSVLVALALALLTHAAVRNLPGLLEMVLLSRLPLDPGARYAITSMARYIILALGVIVVSGRLGMRWDRLQWLVAALSVGLGFGLQEIVANFISGLIILFERPFRLGDTVTIGDVTGRVTRIQIRATTVIDWDRRELIVPNKEFIVGQLINWSLSDPIIRIILPVGIAYGSDTETARRLLLEQGRKHPEVLTSPEPKALFLGFGDNSLNFELRVFINGIDRRFEILHDLHMGVDRAFRDAGICIAFPQRDVHLDTVAPLEVRIARPGRG